MDKLTILGSGNGQLRTRVEELEEEDKRLRLRVESFETGLTEQAREEINRQLEDVTKQINQTIEEALKTGKAPQISIHLGRREKT